MKTLTSKIKSALKGCAVIVGIGNRLRGDDGFGPVMIERLKGKIDAVLLDAGSAPESFLGPIIKSSPETVIILDTADLGVQAGGIDILDKKGILRVGFSTHDASPALFMDYLEDSTDADVFMIAVQPKNIRFGEGLSAEAKEAADRLEKTFVQIAQNQHC